MGKTQNVLSDKKASLNHPVMGKSGEVQEVEETGEGSVLID